MSHIKQLWLPESKCTGCGACENVCPKNAIKIELNKNGHLLPVPLNGCIECGKCESVCDGRLRVSENYAQPTIYAAWSKDDDLRFTSTSGGVFTELASVAIANNGVVFGALYDEECIVRHASAETFSDLEKLKQSKYVQSNMGLTFRAIRSELSKNRNVLFCGAPCQVAALRAYLGEEENNNLFLIDFVCMGVNSPKAYIAWLKQLEKQEQSKVKRVWFKYKKGGWKTSPRRTRIDFINGKTVIQDGMLNYYMSGYLDSCLYLRPSCVDCDFRGFPRYGDITVADFWGIDARMDDDKGTSMVMINNKKGESLFQYACRNLHFEERPFERIFPGNARINEDAALNSKSQLFLDDLDSMGFNAAYKKYSKSLLRRKLIAVAKKLKNIFK